MLPPFQAPVPRPDLVYSFNTISLRGGASDAILGRIFDLIHGANYNDPQRFVPRNYHTLRRSS